MLNAKSESALCRQGQQASRKRVAAYAKGRRIIPIALPRMISETAEMIFHFPRASETEALLLEFQPHQSA